jgi:SAM-dependent methyltransferase
MGGLLPERPDFARIGRVLDLACGPGGWVHEVAAAHPTIEVVGVDLSRIMIEYAQAHARARKLDNARFQVMDVTRPLAFADASFDLVNARLLFAFMPLSGWPALVQEGRRLLRPAGLLRLTECEWFLTKGSALEHLSRLLSLAFKQSGRSFSLMDAS